MYSRLLSSVRCTFHCGKVELHKLRKKEGECTVVYTIEILPPCLLVHFVRWKKWQGPKNKVKVNFTETLDVRMLLDSEGELQNDPQYNLRSVLEHDGTAKRGHYTNLTLTVDKIVGTDDEK